MDPSHSRPVHVWRALPHEAEHVAALLIAFRNHFGRDWPSDNAMLAGVEKLIEETSVDYLLAAPDDDSPPLGVCQLRYRHSVWTAGPDCWLEDLYVARRARRRGVGDALVRAAIRQATERGARRVELDVNENNEAAIALYEGHGFSASAKSDDGARDLFMGLRLPEPD